MTNVGNVGPKALVVSNGRGHARDATMRSFAPRPRTKPAGAQVRVLIVDDEREIHEDFESILGPPVGSESDDLAAAFGEEARVERNPDFDLQHAMSGEEAYELIAAGRRRNEPIAVAYVDVRMPPGIDGLETVRKIREIDRDVEIVIMTAYADKPLPEIVHDIDLLHKLLYVRKPFTRQEVQQITLALTAKWTVERDLVASQQQLVAVLDATGEAIAAYGTRQRLLYANRGYEEIMGAGQSELQAMSPEALATRFEERFRRPGANGVEGAAAVFVDGSGDVVEHVAPGVGENRLFHRSRKPLRNGRGEVTAHLFVYRDVSTALEIERMRMEVTRLRSEVETNYSFARIIGSGPAMQRMYDLMRRALGGDVTVLITGESGTGKELVAKALHFGGARKEHPFVAINCAAIPPALIESELFGHEQGAFTGATTRRLGCFERAHGGTVLLDEIGDMHPELQAKLLRVLQEGEVQRIGGDAPLPVDVRVIASTNQDLSARLDAGEFRADLYFRLNTFPIAVPPLRKRREDIPLLAGHFLKEICERHGKAVSGISAGASRLMMRYEWPGNVRELQSAIERAVLLEATETLQPGSLPPPIAPAAVVVADADGEVVVPLAEMEQQAIRRALAATDHNVSQAARALGINRATLHRKLNQLNRHDLS